MEASQVDLASADERTRQPRLRGGLQAIALLLASVLGTLLLLEAALRVYHSVSLTRDAYALPPEAARAMVPSRDPELAYEWNPGWSEDGFSVNALGMADRDVALAKPVDTFRIALLGDSITANFRLLPPGEETYVTPLRAALEELHASSHIEILNFAVNGYSLLQSARMLETRALRFAPDLAIVQLCLNDPHPSNGVYTPMAPPTPSRLWDFVQRRLSPDRFWSQRLVEYQYDAPGIENLEQAFRRIAAATRSGPPVLAVLFPYLYEPAYSSWGFARYHAAYRDAAAAAGVAFLDLYEPLRRAGAIGSRGYPADPIHPGAAVHELAAATILDEVERRGFLPTRASRAAPAESTSPRGRRRRGAPRTSPCPRSGCAR